MMEPAGVDIDASLDAIDAGRHEISYAGWPVTQMLDDLTRLAVVINRTKPDVVVETGTASGGCALWYAALVPQVVTVDINLAAGDATRRHPAVTLARGQSSVDPDLVGDVRRLTASRGRTMVVLDSLHVASHVTAEIDAYAPLVTPSCYLVVQDAIYDHASFVQLQRMGMPYIALEGGPGAAVEARLATSPWWRRATEIEGLTPLSQCPYGWWQRL
jgi:cephalosporin hydroxylase